MHACLLHASVNFKLSCTVHIYVKCLATYVHIITLCSYICNYKSYSPNLYSAGGIDYNSGPYNVTFSPGVTRAPFDIMINNDNILERNESFRLTIAMDSLPKKVTNVSIAQATVIIVDDDSK